MNRDLDAASRHTAVITGAAGGGIGTALARSLAEDGYRLVLNDKNESALGDLVAELSEASTEMVPAPGDVADRSEAATVLAAVRELPGGADILVHNAAPAVPARPVEELTDEEWLEDVETILFGAFYFARGMIPLMKERRWGRIIFISSNAARRGARGRSAGYAAAKAGLHGLVRQIAVETGQHGITANAVAPSQIDTPRVRRGGRRTDESLAAYARAYVPVGRVGSPADVVAVVRFLASEEAAYVTGQVISVDGGSALSPTGTATADRP